MVDLLSSPILVTIILGTVGLAIPAIDAARRERGRDRNRLYSAIAFGALIVAIAIIVDRKSTRLNSSHANISYAVFCLKKKKIHARFHLHNTEIQSRHYL